MSEPELNAEQSAEILGLLNSPRAKTFNSMVARAIIEQFPKIFTDADDSVIVMTALAKSIGAIIGISSDHLPIDQQLAMRKSMTDNVRLVIEMFANDAAQFKKAMKQ